MTVWKLAPHSTAPHSNLIRLIVMKGRNALVYAARASAYKIEKGGISRIVSLGGGGGGKRAPFDSREHAVRYASGVRI